MSTNEIDIVGERSGVKSWFEVDGDISKRVGALYPFSLLNLETSVMNTKRMYGAESLITE